MRRLAASGFVTIAITLILPMLGSALTTESLGVERACADPLGPTAGCHAWSSRVTNPGQASQIEGVLLSPDGQTAYAWGAFADSSEQTNATVAAFDLATGALLWSHERDGPARARDTITDIEMSADGARIFASGAETSRVVPSPGGWASYADAYVLALDAGTGTVLWDHRVASVAPGGSAAATSLGLLPDGSALWSMVIRTEASSPHATLLVLDAVTGTVLRETPLPTYASSTTFEIQPGAPGEMLLWSTRGDELRIEARSATDGELLRSATHAFGGSQAHLQTVLRRDDGALFLAPSWGTSVRRFDPQTLSVAWETTLASRNHFLDHRASLSPDGSAVYVVGFDPYALQALDAQTGALLWTWLAPEEATLSGVQASAAGVLLAGRWSPTLSLDRAPVLLDTTSRTAGWELSVDGEPRWMGVHNQRADAAWGTTAFASADGHAVVLGNAKGADVGGGAWTLDAFQRVA